MEEVDNIVIHSLREIGCDIDENITNLASFDIELVVKTVVKCLKIIKPELELSPVLPTNLAARFHMATMLAEHCSDLGYQKDIGLQTFLYHDEEALRKVFILLIEKLPKESEKVISEPITKCAELEKLISSAIASEISVPWLPYYCHKKRSKYDVRIRVPFKTVYLETFVGVDEESRNYAVKFKPSILEQVPPTKQLVPSVIALNSRLEHASSSNVTEEIEWLNSKSYDKTVETSEANLYLLGRLISGINLKHPQSDSVDAVEISKMEIQNEFQKVEDEKTAEEQEIKKLQNECETLKANLEELQTEVKTLAAECERLSVAEQQEAKEIAAIEDESKLILKAVELLENGEENIQILEESIEASIIKLINLANQWERHRVPTLKEYRDEKEKHTSKAGASQKKLDEIRLLKEKEKELQEECRNKDQKYSQLVVEVQKLPKEVNRSAYTQRILEIINNVRKQKDEIDKILVDTHDIKKEINLLTGKLDRSYSIVEDIIYHDTGNSEASKTAYKLLVTLHSHCDELVTLVQQTGTAVKEIRDIKEQIEQESAKNVAGNLERITADLEQMKQEHDTLSAQLKKKENSG